MILIPVPGRADRRPHDVQLCSARVDPGTDEELDTQFWHIAYQYRCTGVSLCLNFGGAEEERLSPPNADEVLNTGHRSPLHLNPKASSLNSCYRLDSTTE